MKGYKAANGNYITGKELEKSLKKYRRELKEYRKQKQIEEETKNKIYMIKASTELKEQKQREQKQQEMITARDNILLALRENNPFSYNQYLIIWDILTSNYSQILTDKCRGRIIKDDILKAIQYIKAFNNEIISPYWEEQLV